MKTLESSDYPPATRLLKDALTQFALLLKVERRILAIIAAYSLAIGFFSLIVPLTVQELVNTFAFAIQPIMIVTLAAIMTATLVFIGEFRVFQSRAVEILVRRLYARVALAITEQLPRFREERFLPRYANRFVEAELLPRALLAMLVDLINVLVGGLIGMTILVMYHPYFLFYNLLLVGGFVTVIFVLGRGGFLATLDVSRRNYDVLNWLQDIAQNLLHFKAVNSQAFLLRKTDALASAYVTARVRRSNILTDRQYHGAVLWQAVGHGGLIALAGWLLAIGQLTLGQFVAAEVIVGTLLLNMETVARRLYALIYVFTSLRELSVLFSLPKATGAAKPRVQIPDPGLYGVRLTCKDVTFAYPDSPPAFQNLNLEVMPGEKVALFSETSIGKTTLALVLAGLYQPASGVIRYNDVDLRDLDTESLNACRGLVLDSRLSLFEGTLEQNISMGRSSVTYEDIRWALQFAEFEEEAAALPLGLQTPIKARGKAFTTSQILRIFVARAIVARPQLLIFDGTLHSMAPAMRETILRRLCSKEEPWSVIFVSNDPFLATHVDRRLVVS